MGEGILTFGNIEIEINNFYPHKTPIFLGDVYIEKVLVSSKISFGKKNYKFFVIMLPKTTAYVKRYDGQTKWMYFLIEDDNLLEKFNTIYCL